jgi:peptidoglycan/xylan/chitin deacetylase (PgdA/CDA1 family)
MFPPGRRGAGREHPGHLEVLSYAGTLTGGTQDAGTGYVLDNHTWDHVTLTTLSASAQAAEMDRAARLVRRLPPGPSR